MEQQVSFTGAVQLDLPDDEDSIEIDGVDVTGRLWELAGAFDGSTIRVRRRRVGVDGGSVDCIELKVTHPEFLQKPMVRRVLKVQEGDDVIDIVDNVEFYLKPEYRGIGIGRSSLYYEALAAHELKFQKIRAVAAGRHDGNDDTVGFKVWPKLGYNAEIPPDVLQRMPAEKLRQKGINLTEPVYLSMLIDSGLYSLWEEYGDGGVVEFDVSSLDSWSMTRLKSLIVEKESE